MNDAPVAPDMTQREVAYEFASPDEGYVKLYWETQANVIGVVTGASCPWGMHCSKQHTIQEPFWG